jgi:hypothetical protein
MSCYYFGTIKIIKKVNFIVAIKLAIENEIPYHSILIVVCVLCHLIEFPFKNLLMIIFLKYIGIFISFFF